MFIVPFAASSVPDQLGKNPDRIRDGAAGLVLHPEEQREELDRVAWQVRQLGDCSKQDVLKSMSQARESWTQRGPSPERSRALGRLQEDQKRLESLKVSDLGGLTEQLIRGSDSRQASLSLLCKVGVGVALAGFLGAMAIPVAAVGLASLIVGGAGVATAATAAIKRYGTPERGTLERLGTYAGMAIQQREQDQKNQQIAQDVKDLVDALGHREGSGVRATEQGVQVGGVWLPRKRPSA